MLKYDTFKPHARFHYYPNTKVISDIYSADDAYAMFLWVGTPVQIVFVMIDTGSPITWFQCDPCSNCYPMQRPPFNTRASTSFKELGCYSDTCLIPMMRGIFGNCTGWTCRYNMQYEYDYANMSQSRSFGMMVTETLNFEHSNIQVKDFIMGCGDSYEGPFRTQFSGVFGLGRGPLSVQSQLHAKAFSFCVVSLGSEKPSSLEFYDTQPPKTNQNGNTNGSIMVPLSENNRYPYYYFVQFVGISINGFMLDIQSRVWGYGLNYDGGIVIDMGTVLTYLPGEAYSVFRSEILKTNGNLTKKSGFEELEFCYKEDPTNVYPTIEFFFQNGDIAGLNFVSFKLDNNQLLLQVEEGTVCLSFAEGKDSALTVIGSNNLQGTLLTYDLVNEILVFTYNKC
ncbi:protein ASPARTIC PROTEASE IN GUARD CELL 1-like [Glycine soja]|uniref:Peptidase A1 domain-containing protein n=3 Tax=Glycine subgen. Soja TaxID=1462606 RepID=I1KD66_SOYBN|nr:protein ASPARTIC PROTEASE IN GUARD CELL 1 [Glycine max]XP_028236644.1 protein ASPARTIC PROTEASE IN GUARD CELL 1-like [Glycine soja]